LLCVSAAILFSQNTLETCERLQQPKFVAFVALISATFCIFFSLSFTAMKYEYTLTQFLAVIEKSESKFGFYFTTAIYFALTIFMGHVCTEVVLNACT
jgi:hypothetical protein